MDGEDQGHVPGSLGVWMDVMLADMRVEVAEDLHRPGPQLMILTICFASE